MFRCGPFRRTKPKAFYVLNIIIVDVMDVKVLTEKPVFKCVYNILCCLCISDVSRVQSYFDTANVPEERQANTKGPNMVDLNFKFVVQK